MSDLSKKVAEIVKQAREAGALSVEVITSDLTVKAELSPVTDTKRDLGKERENAEETRDWSS